MPAIHLIPGLMATLVITRYRHGEVLVLVDAAAPVNQVLRLGRVLLADLEHQELARVLTH